MFRVMLVVFALAIVIIGGGMLYLGAFPPKPPAQQVERVLPNDTFKQR